MNFVKPISTILLLASVVGSAAPLVQAKRNDIGAAQLMYMNPKEAMKYVEGLSLHEQAYLRRALVDQYGMEVNRLWHPTNTTDLMTLLAQVGPIVHKKAKWFNIGMVGALGTAGTFALGAGGWINAVANHWGRNQHTASTLRAGALVELGLGALCLLMMAEPINRLEASSYNPFNHLPKVDVASMSFFGLRGLRQTIAKELSQELNDGMWCNNRIFGPRATRALEIEKAYSRKQLQIAAVSGAVVLGALLVYLAVSSVRKNAKAKAATIGAGVAGGITGLLSLSPLATPFVNEKLKRLQSKYRESLAQVRSAGK